MNRGRVFGYIYEINSLEVKAYLLPGTDSLIQSHPDGISRIARIGSYVVVSSGGTRLVGVIRSLHVSEPEKLYWLRTRADYPDKQLIRTIDVGLIGQFYSENTGERRFERGINSYPSIDEEVLAPTQEEIDLILNEDLATKKKLIEIGFSYPTSDVRIKLNPVKLFSRHCGVFGGTGNGKSCTVTAIVNEVLRNDLQMSVFVFDVNGEYSWAWRAQKTRPMSIYKFVGGVGSGFDAQKVLDGLRLNYATLSRNTFRTILRPSEKTQVPALNFACDCIKYLGATARQMEDGGVAKERIPPHLRENPDTLLAEFILGDPSETDGTKLEKAYRTVRFVAALSATKTPATDAVPVRMSLMAALISDRWSIVPRPNGGYQYDAFRYGNVSSLCDRIVELCRDPLFQAVFETSGKSGLDIRETAVGSSGDKCALTILDFSAVPQEYIPVLADAILEQQLLEALKGNFRACPHLLVLDEAHHYLGQRDSRETDTVYIANPPGERIAKEGRKYGLHMLLSSQRPRELSRTIVAQVGTIIAHALTHESDREVVSGFGAYNDRTILDVLSVLPRREAVIIGQAISMPTRFKVTFLPREIRPLSVDPLEEIIEPKEPIR